MVEQRTYDVYRLRHVRQDRVGAPATSRVILDPLGNALHVLSHCTKEISGRNLGNYVANRRANQRDRIFTDRIPGQDPIWAAAQNMEGLAWTDHSHPPNTLMVRLETSR